MSLADFFSPVQTSNFTPKNGYISSQLGTHISVFEDDFPDIDNGDFNLALIGVQEERGAVNNEGCALAPDYIREKLYSLNEGTFKSKIADLGNIKAGEKLSDTYIALKMVVAELVKKNICPIVIGGSQDLTYAQYMAYEELEQKVDLLVIDSHFDLDETAEDTIGTNSVSYLNKIFLHQPNYLFNFSNLGYQTYFVSQDTLRVMDKLFFDAQRLGEISGAVYVAEPAIRSADMISFDVSSIRASDAMGNANAGPNGFYGEEACQMCRYAGYSDKLSSIGFFEMNPAYDQNGQTAMLVAQMIWCFIDGYYSRKKDFPLNPKSDYVIYRTSLKEDAHELIFVKSKKTDRWWMQVPYPTMGSKNERYHMVPCLYEDYQLAISGEMPDLWWRTYHKLN
ncbi:arginase [Pelobium manganitolerans]|uniref:Arginase n=1 Tax=Pelobium manganitolerans TaxID=1842495 RepID=A0A419SC34_9SPHI|nr:formimidoylglutamase [Pelobium manganitolerans]RKD20384.1 arginase [Pelobium manganitolerans]